MDHGSHLIKEPEGGVMFHPIQNWQDDRLRPDGGRKVIKRRFEREGLYCQQHGVERPGEISGVDQLRLQRNVAKRANDLETVLLQLLGPLRPYKKRYVS